jgi:hypothetical protein
VGLIELVFTVCMASQLSQCEEQHLQFEATFSPQQCAMAAQPYIAQWINEHPQWVAVRWSCDYPEKRRQSI